MYQTLKSTESRGLGVSIRDILDIEINQYIGGLKYKTLTLNSLYKYTKEFILGLSNRGIYILEETPIYSILFIGLVDTIGLGNKLFIDPRYIMDYFVFSYSINENEELISEIIDILFNLYDNPVKDKNWNVILQNDDDPYYDTLVEAGYRFNM